MQPVRRLRFGPQEPYPVCNAPWAVPGTTLAWAGSDASSPEPRRRDAVWFGSRNAGDVLRHLLMGRAMRDPPRLNG